MRWLLKGRSVGGIPWLHSGGSSWKNLQSGGHRQNPGPQHGIRQGCTPQNQKDVKNTKFAAINTDPDTDVQTYDQMEKDLIDI